MHGWIEQKVDLDSGKEATVYINPKAALKVTYISQEIDSARQEIWEAIWDYTRESLTLQEAQLSNPKEGWESNILKVKEAEAKIKKLLRRFIP